MYFFSFFLFTFFSIHTYYQSSSMKMNWWVSRLARVHIFQWISTKKNKQKLLQTKTYIEKDLYFDLCHRSRNRRGISTCWIFGYWAHNQLNTICINIDGMVHACVLMDAKNTYKHTHMRIYKKKTNCIQCADQNSIVLLWHTLLSTQTRLTENQSNEHTITIWSNCKMTCKNKNEETEKKKQKKRNIFFG